MNPSKQKPQLAELAGTGVKLPPVMPGAAGKFRRLDQAGSATQRRMEARQPAESGANHARHHVARKTQS